MEVIISEKGRNFGRISVSRTIATMEVGEVWALQQDGNPVGNVRVNCSRYGQLTGKFFNVRPVEGGMIEIRRAR